MIESFSYKSLIDSLDHVSLKQVTWGYNIVADGWAGVANLQPHPNLLPTHYSMTTAAS